MFLANSRSFPRGFRSPSAKPSQRVQYPAILGKNRELGCGPTEPTTNTVTLPERSAPDFDTFSLSPDGLLLESSNRPLLLVTVLFIIKMTRWSRLLLNTVNFGKVQKPRPQERTLFRSVTSVPHPEVAITVSATSVWSNARLTAIIQTFKAQPSP